MAAQMLAASAGFGVADPLGHGAWDLQPRVIFNRRQPGTQRDLETQAIERDQRLGLDGLNTDVSSPQTRGERHQTGLEFAAQDGPGADAPQVRFI